MTIKDIAKKCGVSVSTVSRVLNNKPDVSEENRQRVLAVIDSNKYIPNNSARDLVKTKSEAIGVILRGVSNPFFIEIIQAIEEEVNAAGYTMVMRQISSDDDEIKCAAVMEREKRLCGIIFLGGRYDYKKEDMQLLNVPYVLCTISNHYGTLDDSDYSSIAIDDTETAHQAVQELINRGHRRIAILLSRTDDCSVSQLRYQGYVKALEKNSIAREDTLVIETESFEVREAYRAMKDHLVKTDNYTALFAISDNMAIGAMRALQECGKKIPQDVSVISIDGLEISEFLTPKLSTMVQPKMELGKKGAQILIGRIRGEMENTHELLETKLQIGETIRSF